MDSIFNKNKSKGPHSPWNKCGKVSSLRPFPLNVKSPSPSTISRPLWDKTKQKKLMGTKRTINLFLYIVRWPRIRLTSGGTHWKSLFNANEISQDMEKLWFLNGVNYPSHHITQTRPGHHDSQHPQWSRWTPQSVQISREETTAALFFGGGGGLWWTIRLSRDIERESFCSPAPNRDGG